MTLEYWFMLPVSILVATIAMASGVEGATFFAPIFILVLGLPPEVAIGVGLITEVFGFASGLSAYARKRLIDYQLGGWLLLVTVPVALLGTWLATGIPADILKTILGVGLFAIALSFLRAPGHGDMALLDGDIQAKEGPGVGETKLVTAAGEEIWYTVCNKNEGRLISGIGALFMGMISTGLGEMNGYFMLQRCRVPSKVAVATSVLIVAVTALVASIGHFYSFMQQGPEVLNTVYSLIIFTIPGVIIGGQLGSVVSGRISQNALMRGLGVLFVLVAVLTLGEVLL
ncbi:MAG TPA: sulfite exporter TauE/SafE family protein [Chloroflexota bacterium]|nr:sulfite exporter TauE/SafE family protein [Chloroflexota bacterium]HUM67281.1 sulfite exporter TauE/SafE family protein [Chloroflexota bacterium]